MGEWFLGNALNSSLLLSHNLTQMSFYLKIKVKLFKYTEV
ncbi:hypothetical protein CUZ89_1906 [Enterococcus xinjiangensis]|nr:hypothetical protein [Enterococcus lactis]